MDGRYWVSPISESFDNSNNWSIVSGGIGGATVPGITNLVFFDGSGLGDCSVNMNLDILDLYIARDYTGTITQNSYPITIRQDATFSGGVFQGEGQDVNVNGSLYLVGGLIHTPEQKISVFGDVACDDSFGSWTSRNDATISMDSSKTQKIITSGGILPTLHINKTSPLPVKVFGDSTALYIKGDFLVNTDSALNSNGHDIYVGFTQPPGTANFEYALGPIGYETYYAADAEGSVWGGYLPMPVTLHDLSINAHSWSWEIWRVDFFGTYITTLYTSSNKNDFVNLSLSGSGDYIKIFLSINDGDSTKLTPQITYSAPC